MIRLENTPQEICWSGFEGFTTTPTTAFSGRRYTPPLMPSVIYDEAKHGGRESGPVAERS
jgi:hypothetical protein